MTLFFACKKNKHFLLLLLLASFGIQALFFHVFFKKEKDHFIPKDSAEYHAVALQIVKGNGISNANGSPSFYRVPGYSLFLALCYWLCDSNITKTIWMQIFLASCIPILMFFHLSVLLVMW